MEKIDKSKKFRYKYEIVASDILARIFKGEWAKGERIDTISELEKTYPYSRMTIFKAVQHLAAQKYLLMRRGSGLYVKNNSIITKIGIIFSEDLLHNQKTPFLYLLFKAAEVFFNDRNVDFKVYIEKEAPDSTKWIPLPDLEADLVSKSLNGILTIGCNAPISLMKTSFWLNNAVPHVSLTSHSGVDFMVTTDTENLLKQVFSYCSRQINKTLGIISTEANAGMISLAKSKKLIIKPGWIINDSAVENNPELTGYDSMMQLWQQKDKPKMLFVSDDIMTKGVTLASLRLNIKVPDDLLIISLSNKNSGVFYPVPVVKFEFDPDEIIKNAGNLLLDLLENPHLKPQKIEILPHLSLEN